MAEGAQPGTMTGWRFPALLLASLSAIFVVLAIAPHYRQDWLLENLLVMVAVPILVVTGVGDWPAVLLIGLAAAAHQAWSANLFTTVSDMFAKKDVATLIGVGGFAGAVRGILFPWLSGRLLDHFHRQGDVTEGYAVLFAICASAYLVSFAIHHVAGLQTPVDLWRAARRQHDDRLCRTAGIVAQATGAGIHTLCVIAAILIMAFLRQ